MRSLAVVFLLAGCATQTMPALPPVAVPVSVPCMRVAPDKPKFYSDSDLHAMNDYQLVLALMADRIERSIYENGLEAAITACIK